MQHTGGRVWETVRYYKSGCRRLQRTPLVETAQYFATLLDGLIQFTQANQAGKVLADMWQQTIAESRLVFSWRSSVPIHFLMFLVAVVIASVFVALSVCVDFVL